MGWGGRPSVGRSTVGAGPAGGGSAHVVVADLGSLELDTDDAHHLHSVLRLRPGEPVGATDGRGGYVPCRYIGRGVIEADGPAEASPPRTPLLTVAFAPIKGDRPEWAVQKLTELGVDRIVLIHSQRSVVRWDAERAAGHLERLRRVARSAVMQSRQWWLPEVAGMTELGTFLAGAPSSAAGPDPDVPGRDGGIGGGVALADMGGLGPGPGLHTVVVGPEGGWTPEERRMASAVVGLGAAVLRAETAAVAAGVLLGAMRAGLVRPTGG